MSEWQWIDSAVKYAQDGFVSGEWERCKAEIAALRAKVERMERVVEAAKSLAFDITEDDDYWRQTESYIDFGLALAALDANDNLMPCGHPISAVHSGVDGTNYCKWCAQITALDKDIVIK